MKAIHCFAPSLSIDVVSVTEAGAIAASRYAGSGNRMGADRSAVAAMRKHLKKCPFQGRIAIGEGLRDAAPALRFHEKTGNGCGPSVDIAVDPLEGTRICANGKPGSLSIMALAQKGQLLHAPDMFMLKIAVGPEAKGVIDLNQPLSRNVAFISKAKKCRIKDLRFTILNRPYNQEFIEVLHRMGVLIKVVDDGDVIGAISTSWHLNNRNDCLFGIGGAPEGVLAATALHCLGGEIQGKLWYRNPDEIRRARNAGIKDLKKIYKHEELARGPVIFCATGVTSGPFLKGVEHYPTKIVTHSVVMSSHDRAINYIDTEHDRPRVSRRAKG
ncbi:MAG: class II fructose-bisphosphatase [Elusimicrobia bacterium]|nr:class II fructose-bisphosphatase [Candidatus Obscuribacterium magneticum]